MSGSGWTRDPVVACAGWCLLGWAGTAAPVLTHQVGSAAAWTIAAALAVCGVGVLQGSRWYVVAAAGVLAAVSLGVLAVAPLNIPIMILLAGAIVRLRAADVETDRVRDPAMAQAGWGCLVAAVAGALWIGALIWTRHPELWLGPLISTAILAAAAVGMLRGVPGWAFVATGSLAVLGVFALTARVAASVTAGWVPMDVALLASVGFAYVRLLRLARGPGVR